MYILASMESHLISVLMILFLTHLAFIEIVESCLEKKHFLMKKVFPNKTSSNYLQGYYVYCGKFNVIILFLIEKH